MGWKHDLKFLIFKRAITVQGDQKVYRHTLKASFIAALIYSVIYGFYEYFIVYHYPNLLSLYGGNSFINWGMMLSALILTVAIAPRFGLVKTLLTSLSYSGVYILTAIYVQNLVVVLLIVAIVISLLFLVSLEHIAMGLFLMTVLEDLIFWIGQWIDTGTYPFPACTIGDPSSCWWNNTIHSFEILGNIGSPIPFWPYIPIYYIPGFAMIALFYISAFIGPKPSRIIAWIFGPFFVAIILGAIGTIATARIILIVLPLVALAYVSILYILRNRIQLAKSN